MLIAVALRDEPAFERVWRWTRAHLRRPDGLFARRPAGRGEPAAGADLDVARALLVAAGTFHRPGHARGGAHRGRGPSD
jgi:endoglucanase